jgi:hypothetical protein
LSRRLGNSDVRRRPSRRVATGLERRRRLAAGTHLASTRAGVGRPGARPRMDSPSYHVTATGPTLRSPAPRDRRDGQRRCDNRADAWPHSRASAERCGLPCCRALKRYTYSNSESSLLSQAKLTAANTRRLEWTASAAHTTAAQHAAVSSTADERDSTWAAARPGATVTREHNRSASRAGHAATARSRRLGASRRVFPAVNSTAGSGGPRFAPAQRRLGITPVAQLGRGGESGDLLSEFGDSA